MRTPFILAAALLIGCGGGSDDPGTDVDATPGVDAPRPVDSGGSDLDASVDGGNVDPPPPTCGTMRPDVRGITGTEGLAIAPDGTMYFSQGATQQDDRPAVGRLRPGEEPEPRWAPLDGTRTTVWGLALTSTHLYAGYRTEDIIWRVELATGTAQRWLEDTGGANGLVIGADGALYYTDFDGDGVYRVDLTTKDRTTIVDPEDEDEDDRINSPNGLYSLDATHLLVLAYSAADVIELTLDNGVETARRTAANLDANAGIRLDGITRDAKGRWYLSDNSGGRVLRRPADFAAPAGGEEVVSTGTIRAAANLAFGRGALDCDVLYVTSFDAMRAIVIDD